MPVVPANYPTMDSNLQFYLGLSTTYSDQAPVLRFWLSLVRLFPFTILYIFQLSIHYHASDFRRYRQCCKVQSGHR